MQMEYSFESEGGSDSEIEDFAAELAAIKAGQRGVLRAATSSADSPAHVKRTGSKANNTSTNANEKVMGQWEDPQEKEILNREIASLVKQVYYFRSERDKAIRALKETQSKDTKKLESMTEAMKKASNEALIAKKQIWVKDREMAAVINKFNSAEQENSRLRQIKSHKASISENHYAKSEAERERDASTYSYREIQELRAQLDTCRVDLATQRKQNVEQNALRTQAENAYRDMETRAIRAEQMNVATEKLLNESESKSASHTAKLYEDIKVLRVGLVDLNSELASQAARGKVELGEMERERRIIATKLDAIVKENLLLLEQSAHQDRSLANQSAVLGTLSAHVHQAPVGSPHRENRIQSHNNQRALDNRNNSSHGQGQDQGHNTGGTGTHPSQFLHAGDLSPTAKRGMLLPLMSNDTSEKGNENTNTDIIKELRLTKRLLHTSREEVKGYQASLKIAQENNARLQATATSMASAAAVRRGKSPPKAAHGAVTAAAASTNQQIARLKAEFAQEAQATSMQIQKMAGTLEFLQTENMKLSTRLQHERRTSSFSSSPPNRSTSPASNVKFSQAKLAQSSSNVHAEGNGDSSKELENLSAEYALAKLQVQALRSNLIQAHREIGKLKTRTSANASASVSTGGNTSANKSLRSHSPSPSYGYTQGYGCDPDQHIHVNSHSHSHSHHQNKNKANDDDSTRRIIADDSSVSTNGINDNETNTNAHASEKLGLGMERVTSAHGLQQRVLNRATHTHTHTEDADMHGNGYENNGVTATMADVLTLQRALDNARRVISTLEAKLAKAEYRYSSVNKMLQNIPSTLNVAQAEKRVLEAQLEKQLESSAFAVATVRADSYKELMSLRRLLDLETQEKRNLSQQMRSQSDMVAQLNERIEDLQKTLFQLQGYGTTLSFSDINAPVLPYVASSSQWSQTQTQGPTHGQWQEGSYSYPPSPVRSSRLQEESLSSPIKGDSHSHHGHSHGQGYANGGSSSSSSFIFSENNNNNNSANATGNGNVAGIPASTNTAENNASFQMLSYDMRAGSILSANEQNYQRLEQAMLSISE